MILVILLAFLISGGFCAGEAFYERDWPRKTLPYLLVLLFLTSCAYGQASRYDGTVYTVNQSAPLPGAMLPVLALSGATVQVCSTWNTSGCTALAVTYQSSTISSGNQCPSTAQLYNALASACSSTADVSGGWGIWAGAGSYAYFVTTAYGTYGPYPFGIDAAGAYVPISGGTNLNFQGTLYANTWQSGGGNNGIAMSLTECASLPYACQILAPTLYATTEAQPWNGQNGFFSQNPPAGGPTTSAPTALVEDDRFGAPMWILNNEQALCFPNCGTTKNYRFWSPMFRSMTLNPWFMSGQPALRIENDTYNGIQSLNGAKANVSAMPILLNKWAQVQGGGALSIAANGFGNGDNVGLEIDNISYGNGNVLGDESNETFRTESIEGGFVWSGTLSSTSANSDGTENITTTPSSDGSNGTQGSGRILIDLTQKYNAGYINNTANAGWITCSGCDWDGTFGTSTQTYFTAATPAPGSTAYPLFNATWTVGSTSGMSPGQTICAWDTDWECQVVSSVTDGSHVVVKREDVPHNVNALVTFGGLAGYAFEAEADRVDPNNLNGVSTMPDSPLQNLVRKATPIIGNLSGNKLEVLYGYSAPASTSTWGSYPGYVGRAYTQMGSGGTVTVTVSGGIVTACSASGGSGYSSSVDKFGNILNQPLITLSGTWTTAPVVVISAVSSGALSGCAVQNPGAGITGSVTATVASQNPYDIYPAAHVINAYDGSTGTFDGMFLTEIPVGSFSASDSIEEPHHWLQQNKIWSPVFGSYFASGATDGLFLNRYGLSSVLADIQDANWTSPTVYAGYPLATPNLLGVGQVPAPDFLSAYGAHERFIYNDMPTLGSLNSSSAFLWEGCGGGYGLGPSTCAPWNYFAYALKATGGASGFTSFGIQWNHQTSELNVVAADISLPLINSTNTTALSTAGALESGIGQNWVTWSNTLTNAAWQTVTGSPTITQISDPVYGTVNQIVCGTSCLLVNAAGTDLTAGQTFSLKAVMKASATTSATLYFDASTTIPNISVGTSWAPYCFTGTASNPATNHWKAAIQLNAAATVDVWNVTVSPGNSCGLDYVNNTGSQVTTATPVNQIAGGNICTAANGQCGGVSVSGTSTLSSGTVTVSNAAACAVGSTCKYALTHCGPNSSTAIGTLSTGTIVAGTSFVINALTATNTVATGDLSTVCWRIN